MEKVYLVITICAIIMIAPMLSKIIKAPVVVIEIVLGLIAGYLGLIYENEIRKLIILMRKTDNNILIIIQCNEKDQTTLIKIFLPTNR